MAGRALYFPHFCSSFQAWPLILDSTKGRDIKLVVPICHCIRNVFRSPKVSKSLTNTPPKSTAIAVSQPLQEIQHPLKLNEHICFQNLHLHSVVPAMTALIELLGRQNSEILVLLTSQFNPAESQSSLLLAQFISLNFLPGGSLWSTLKHADERLDGVQRQRNVEILKQQKL